MSWYIALSIVILLILMFCGIHFLDVFRRLFPIFPVSLCI